MLRSCHTHKYDALRHCSQLLPERRVVSIMSTSARPFPFFTQIQIIFCMILKKKKNCICIFSHSSLYRYSIQIKNILAPSAADPKGSWKSCKMGIKNCSPAQIQTMQGKYWNSPGIPMKSLNFLVPSLPYLSQVLSLTNQAKLLLFLFSFWTVTKRSAG